ncbi:MULTISPECIES: hypothetical protein [Dokdonia]|jgi:hypothetical protein|uniref:Uncharacterized protein n=1 Tax=Dokdonia donghaensis DSW-1 TaxID=1300343 RepID=A0A0A2H293_9FLAO|nr:MULTISPECIES: hypothetical protein [Dokdonia]ANH59365.1 hypothetical protein I597_0433 [Dokdonia donghaensis DSW-1]EAQ39462.1 hypothetical protein MED134_08226 [Dokdonia sp. MED134]KGO06760.1 hypothetical protein NV36_07820 [Dokdonia donghaensis DSW-1]
MKFVIPIGILLALGLLIYNLTLLDFSNPLQGDSSIALIGIIACACAILLLLILRTSRKIAEKHGK